jgi:WD40 repeat protein
LAADEAPTLAPSGVDLAPVSGEVPSVPGYEIVAELGRGAMGVVYQARQSQLNRLVALKMVLHGSHASSADLERFLAEGEAVAQLQHANIVQIHEVGQHSGLPFFCLEYVAGGTLAQRLRRGPLPPREAAQLTETLARTMAYAHSRGLIHRDLKPSNVLLAVDGTPKITDFGLAKRVEGGGHLTATGAVLGTPSYMAPEQAGGKKDISALCDVYSLGALLYEMLTGRPPFQAPTPLDTLMRVMNEEPVPPRRLQPKVPRDLETICLKCLQKEPHKRYASAAELADDLARFREDRPIVARPVSRLERGWRWCRRNPVIAALSAAAAGFVVVAALLLYQERSQTLTNLTRAEGAERDLTNQLELTAQAERERTEQLWQSYHDRARAGRSSGKAGQRFGGLDALTSAARIRPTLDLRNEFIACLALADVRFERAVPAEGFNTYLRAIDLSFKHYAWCDPKGDIVVRRLEDGGEAARLPGTGTAPAGIALWFSADERWLMIDRQDRGGPREKFAWKWRDGRPEKKVPLPEAIAEGLDFHPTLPWIVLSDMDGSSLLYDRVTHNQIGRLPPGALSADGRHLAVVRGNSVAILDTERGQRLVATYPLPAPTETSWIAWRGDGQLLAVGCSDHCIYVWDTARNALLSVLEGHQSAGIRPLFSNGGDFLISLSWDNTTRLWDPVDGRSLVSVPGMFIGLSPDDRHMALHAPDGRLEVWEVAAGRECRTLHPGLIGNRSQQPPHGLKHTVDWHPSGRLLVSGSKDGAHLWESATGRELALLPAGRCEGVCFLPDGTLLTAGSAGMLRWPVTATDEPGDSFRVGPPTPLPAFNPGPLARDRDGRRLAGVASGIVRVADLADLRQTTVLQHPAATNVALSPDGTLAASGTWGGNGVRVWDARTGALLKELGSGNAYAAFSPDGERLAVGTTVEISIWRVGSWDTPERVIARAPGSHLGWLTFTPDGRGLAVAHSSRLVRLVDLASGNEIASLTAPDEKLVTSMRFSPDGSRLAVTTENYVIQLWDLRELGHRLREAGLDWEAPDFSPAPSPHPPVRLTVLDNRPGRPPQPPQPEVVVVNAPGAKPRPATPEQLAGWVKQLADPEARTRTEAAKALEEVGPPALKVLDTAAEHPERAVRERVKQVRDRIEVAEALKPRRLNLRLKDAPVAEAVQALAKQARMPLTYVSKAPADGSPAKTVTLDLEGVTFLEALDRLCERAELHSTQLVNPVRWQLIDGTPAPSATVAYAGPLRLHAHRIELLRTLDLRGRPLPDDLLRLHFSLERGSAATVVAWDNPRVEEARDNANRSLRPEHPAAASPILATFNTLAITSQSALLQPPTERGGTLKYLKVVVPVDVMVRQREVLTVPELARAAGKVVQGDDGFRCRVLSVQMTEPNSVTIQFSMSVPEGQPLDSRLVGLRLIDGKGGQQTLLSAARSVAPLTKVRGLEPEDLRWLSGSLSAGFPAAVPWSALVPPDRKLERRQTITAARFLVPGGLSSSAKLTLFRFERLRTDVSFEFHDLPLP